MLTVLVLLERSWRRLFSLIPHYVLVAAYLVIHLLFFGLPPGSVYVLQFSPKVLNTLGWYLLWAFNLPELLVDYIGPGLHINPNLWAFHGTQTMVILAFFAVTVTGALFALVKKPKGNWAITIIAASWFFLTLVPVAFLPWHKFTYELGVPLVGLVLFLGWLMARQNNKFLLIICGAWLATSLFTLRLTAQTHWIVQGAQVAKRVETYFRTYQGNKNIVFYDTPADAGLPWSPASELKLDLSNQDFFAVFYPGKYQVAYLSQLPDNRNPTITYLSARKFMGY
ncbi:MAG: hypothetical protein M1484_00530 [Patescibacteria group bacterium]|nr:hypothetical protein [Patescibacteria group bacterium]MCL5431566.1 hypothetical protein [Patescibacteria group bacterium]